MADHLHNDVELLEVLLDALQQSKWKQFESLRADLVRLQGELVREKDSAEAQKEATQGWFREFMNAHPELWPVLAEHLARQTIYFVKDACQHYEAVKGRRPFTPEENAMGEVLMRLLQSAKGLFHSEEAGEGKET